MDHRFRSIALAIVIALPFLASAQSTQPVGPFPDLDKGRPPANVEMLRRVQSTSHLLLLSSLLFLVFALTTFLLLRRRGGESKTRQATPYVDAWASYRVSEESIQAATREEPPARPHPLGDQDDALWDDEPDSPDEPDESK